MSAGHSDIIPILSTNVPLGPSPAQLLTSGYIAGQYSSLSITCFASTNTEVEVQFSGDGVNWDVTEFKSFIGGAGGVEAVVVLSKWVRLRIINTDTSAQAFLRVSTYGTIRNSVVQAVLDTTGGGTLPELNIGNLPGTSTALRAEHARTLFSFCGASVQTCDHTMTFNHNPGNMMFSIDNDAYQLAFQSPSPATNGLVTIQGTGQTGQRSLVVYSNNGTGVSSAVGDSKSYLSPRYSSGSTTGNLIFTFCTDYGGRLFSSGGRGNFFTPLDVPVRNQVLTGVTTGVSNGSLDSAENFVLFGAWDETFAVTHTEMNIIYRTPLGGLVVLPQSQWNIDPCDGTRNLPSMDLYNYSNSTSFLSGRIIMNLSQHGYIRWELAHPSTGVYYPVHRVANVLFGTRLFCALIHKHEVKQLDMPMVMTHAFQSLEEEIIGSGTGNVKNDNIESGINTVVGAGGGQFNAPLAFAIRKRSRDFPGGQVQFTSPGSALVPPYERHIGETTYLKNLRIRAWDTGGNPTSTIKVVVWRMHQHQVTDGVGEWSPVNPRGWVTSAEYSTTTTLTDTAGSLPQLIAKFEVPADAGPSSPYNEIVNPADSQNLFWALVPGTVIALLIIADVGRTIATSVEVNFINKI